MNYCSGVFLIELNIFQLNVLNCSIHTGLPLIVCRQKARALASCILFVVFHVTTDLPSQVTTLLVTTTQPRHRFESLNFYDFLVALLLLFAYKSVKSAFEHTSASKLACCSCKIVIK